MFLRLAHTFIIFRLGIICWEIEVNKCVDVDAMLKLKCECQLLIFASFRPYLSKTCICKNSREHQRNNPVHWEKYEACRNYCCAGGVGDKNGTPSTNCQVLRRVLKLLVSLQSAVETRSFLRDNYLRINCEAGEELKHS